MTDIERLLELATPEFAEAPPIDEIRALIRRRRTARVAGGAAVVAALVIAALSAMVTRTPGEIETVGIDTTLAPTTSAPTTDLLPTTSETAPTPATVPASEARWFLVPPEGTSFSLFDNHLEWGQSPSAVDAERLVLSSNPDDLPDSGLAVLYYLDDAKRDYIGDPGTASNGSRFVTLGGQTVRVRSEPGTSRVSAFRDRFVDDRPGAFVVLGTGITEDEAVQIALAAHYGEPAPIVDQPDGFALTPLPRREPNYLDHLTTVWWETDRGRANLRMEPSTLPLRAALFGSGQEIRWVDSPMGDTVYVPPVPNQNVATLLWAEDNMVMTLTIGEESDGAGLEDLLAEAIRLERVSQPEATRRIVADNPHPESPILADRVAVAADWLSLVPVPPWVDQWALIQGPPNTEFGLSTFLLRYLTCSWYAELEDAEASADPDRIQIALDAFASQLDWPILKTAAISARAINPGLAGNWEDEVEYRERQRADIESAESIEEAAALYLGEGKYASSSCDFHIPRDS